MGEPSDSRMAGGFESEDELSTGSSPLRPSSLPLDMVAQAGSGGPAPSGASSTSSVRRSRLLAGGIRRHRSPSRDRSFRVSMEETRGAFDALGSQCAQLRSELHTVAS